MSVYLHLNICKQYVNIYPSVLWGKLDIPELTICIVTALKGLGVYFRAHVYVLIEIYLN